MRLSHYERKVLHRIHFNEGFGPLTILSALQSKGAITIIPDPREPGEFTVTVTDAGRAALTQEDVTG